MTEQPTRTDATGESFLIKNERATAGHHACDTPSLLITGQHN